MKKLLHLAGLLLVANVALAGPNVLPNAGFEHESAGWLLWHEDPDASSGGIIGQPAREGKHCFKVANRGSGGANLHSDPVPAAGVPTTRFRSTPERKTHAVFAWPFGRWGRTARRSATSCHTAPRCPATSPPGHASARSSTRRRTASR